jgi:hypothetical protein
LAVASFDHFCAAICQLMGVDPPTLAPDPRGLAGFTVNYRNVGVGFVKTQRGSETGLLMLVQFGMPSPRDELECLRNLLNSNFHMTGPGAPAFALDPATGDVWLIHSFLLSQVSVRAIFEDIAAATDAVPNWRTDQGCGAVDDPSSSACDRSKPLRLHGGAAAAKA